MQTASGYFRSTESAVRKLFAGIKTYVRLLEPIRGTTFVSGQIDPVKFQAEYEAWARRNARRLKASLRAQQNFAQQSFALATLCGAVLQVASKAIECYSTNTNVPADLQSLVGKSKSAIPYCIGRKIRDVPIGLIIYAGRNQHSHYNESALAQVNQAVFNRIAALPQQPDIKDPALNLDNPLLHSFAANVTHVLGWRTYAAYQKDLRTMLVAPNPSIERTPSGMLRMPTVAAHVKR